MVNIIYEPLKAFINPSQRIYWIFLASSIIISILLFKKSKQPSKNFFNFLGGKKNWLSQSSITDYTWFILGFWINFFLITPFIIPQVDLNMILVSFFYKNFSPLSIELNSTSILTLYTITLIVLFDFTYYLIHRSMHKYKFLWDCHKFHHSATSLTPITLYRTHPIEYIIFAIQKVSILGLVTSLFIYQFGMVVQPIQFFGIGVGALFFGILGANLRHSTVEFKYFNYVENIFISPYMHQIHHGNKANQHHSNFGAIFSVWDNLFGTLNKSKNIQTNLKYGIEGYTHTSIIQSVFLPIINLIKGQKNEK